ncbi:MAG: hypothetical protein PUF14_00890 [Clostridiales bacterium]|nr:hypothetical protein [Clostridiales bacterium]
MRELTEKICKIRESEMKTMIKYLVMDVDGTLTDGKVYIGNDGEVCKAFHIKDGYGIHDIAMPKGIIPVIITGRCMKLPILVTI